MRDDSTKLSSLRDFTIQRWEETVNKLCHLEELGIKDPFELGIQIANLKHNLLNDIQLIRNEQY